MCCPIVDIKLTLSKYKRWEQGYFILLHISQYCSDITDTMSLNQSRFHTKSRNSFFFLSADMHWSNYFHCVQNLNE